MINRKYLNILYNELVSRLDETLFTPEEWQKIKNEKRNARKWAAVLKNSNLLKGFIDSEGHDLDELIDIVHEGEPDDSSELSDDPMSKPMGHVAAALAQQDLGRFDEAGNVVCNTRDTKDTDNINATDKDKSAWERTRNVNPAPWTNWLY